MTSYQYYTYTQGATPSQWANAYTLGPPGAQFNCYPSPTSEISIVNTFYATGDGCPFAYKFSSDAETTTCLYNGYLATPITYTWDCVFTVGTAATMTVDGGTSTLTDGPAVTATAAPQFITVTQTVQETSTITNTVNPGGVTVTVTSTTTKVGTQKRSIQAVKLDLRQSPNPQMMLGLMSSNGGLGNATEELEITKRDCSGYLCLNPIWCCTGGETCVSDGSLCCATYECVSWDPTAPFTSYGASWLYFTAPIRTYFSTIWQNATTYQTTHIASGTVTVTPTTTTSATLTNTQTVSTTTTMAGATVTITTILTTTLIISSSVTLSIVTASTGGPTTSKLRTPVARWTGVGNILNGDCGATQYVLLDGATAYWAPFIGCISDKPDCCPFSVASTTQNTPITVLFTPTVTVFARQANPSGSSSYIQGYPVAANPDQSTLAHCPDDYQTVLNGCCPSGYQLWETLLGGQVPCFSTLTSYLVPPPIPATNLVEYVSAATTVTKTVASGASASVTPPAVKQTMAIQNVVYAIYYPVAPSSSALSTAEQAGIGAGAGVVGIAIITLILLFWRNKRKNKREAEANIVPPNYNVIGQSGKPPMSPYVGNEHQGLQPYNSTTPHQPSAYPPQDTTNYPPRPVYRQYQHQYQQNQQGQPWPQQGAQPNQQSPQYQEAQQWPQQQQQQLQPQPYPEQQFHHQMQPQPQQSEPSSSPKSPASPVPASNGHSHSSHNSWVAHSPQPELQSVPERHELLGQQVNTGHGLPGRNQ